MVGEQGLEMLFVGGSPALRHTVTPYNRRQCVTEPTRYEKFFPLQADTEGVSSASG